ncbi:hypothetical protein ABG768_000843, partial [Culter alburnus]
IKALAVLPPPAPSHSSTPSHSSSFTKKTRTYDPSLFYPGFDSPGTGFLFSFQARQGGFELRRRGEKTIQLCMEGAKIQ